MSSDSPQIQVSPRRPRRVYVPAIGPRLRVLLYVVFVSVALLGATGFYLLAIRMLEAWRLSRENADLSGGSSYVTQFTLWMFLVHVLGGVVLMLPFLIFGITHLITARKRENQLAVRLGILLFACGLIIGLSGLALIQLDVLPQLPTGTLARWLVWGLHVVTPLLAVVLYVLHRRAGPAIKWHYGYGWGGAVVAAVAAMTVLHSHDPRTWYVRFSPEGDKYFEPSKARTAGLGLIPAQAMLMDEYCLKCHADIYNSHLHSAHRFSSFSNPAYLFSVRETRERMGVRASRWCAGCHDPVPFFSGAFDNPFEDERFDPQRDVERVKKFLETEAILDPSLTKRTYPELLAQFLDRESRRRADFHAERFRQALLPALEKEGDRLLDIDPARHPMATGGITCTVCHSITHINSRSGNADYIIEEPIHYPFAYSDNPVLQWINNQLVKAKPDFHKQTFLKPFHRDEERFCSTCHKVGIPMEVNHYKEFLRGQNHPDSFFLSGVSGHGVRSFYYPPKAKSCNDCHMPLQPSDDFGSRDFDGSGVRKVHTHFFRGANTGVPGMVRYPGYEEAIRRLEKFLQHGPDGKSPTLRIDIFGLKQLTKEHRGVDSPLLGGQPLRPYLPTLEPGGSYLVDVVIRTLNMGHQFTQGTADSNEVWVEFVATSGGRVIGRSGGMDGPDRGAVDKRSHFINVLMLDRHGNRIDRRNPQDIFTPLYNHQIPPGAAQIVHYRLDLPTNLTAPVELYARVRYRKFDQIYMDKVFGKGKAPVLPIIDLCADWVALPVRGAPAPAAEKSKKPIEPAWQRWNDYGIACFLTGGPEGKEKGERKQAQFAFEKLVGPEFKDVKDAHAHGWLNLARVHYSYGGLDKAREALVQASKADPPAPWWTVSWFNGLINTQDGNFDAAIEDFQTILEPSNQPRSRGFDFTQDWLVMNELGKVYFYKSQGAGQSSERERYLRLAIEQFEKTLKLDPEDVFAHDFLHRCYEALGREAEAAPERPAPSAAEEKLLQQADALADRAQDRAARTEAAKELLRLLKEKEARYAPAVLAEVRQRCVAAAPASRDAWLWLAVAPAVSEIDRQLIAAVPQLGAILKDDKQPKAARQAAAVTLAQVLRPFGDPPAAAPVAEELAGLTAFGPKCNAVKLALAGMADNFQLQGGLPPRKLLTLQALRLEVRPLLDSGDAELGPAVVRVLAAIHDAMHRIYRPDDTAEGRVRAIYLSRHPEANPAAENILIYDLK